MEYGEGRTLSQSLLCQPSSSKTSSFTFLSSSSNLQCQCVDESYSNISYIQAIFFHSCASNLEICIRVYWVF